MTRITRLLAWSTAAAGLFAQAPRYLGIDPHIDTAQRILAVVAGLLMIGISRNRPRSPSQVMHSASRSVSSATPTTIAPLMKVSITGPRFLRRKKWHETRHFARY